MWRIIIDINESITIIAFPKTNTCYLLIRSYRGIICTIDEMIEACEKLLKEKAND